MVIETIKQQVELFPHLSSDLYHPVWIELSERVATIAPYKDSAIEAIEIIEVAITEAEREGID